MQVCEVAGMRITFMYESKISLSENCHSMLGMSYCPKGGSLSILGSYSQVKPVFAESPVMVLYLTVVVKRELCQKAKLSI